LYTFTPTAGLCSPTTSMTITVNPNDDPNFTYVSGTYCLTGTDPSAVPGVGQTGSGTYTITAPGVINPTTGLIDLGLSGLGTFTVTYTTPAGNPCSASTTFPITITSAPSAIFTYDGATYCQNAIAPILTYGAGASGGVFTSVPGGLAINPGTGAVDPSTSTPGLYTVTNNIAAAGGCGAALETTTIEIFQVDSALFTYSNGTYCLTGTDPGATIGANGTNGGTFTITAPGVIDPSTGVVNLTASGLGAFTITYNTTSAGNPCPVSATIQITITSAPSTVFTYDGPMYCQNATAPVLTYGPGASGGVFTSAPLGLSLNGGTGAVDPSISTPGLYTVYNTIAAAGGCAASLDSAMVEIFQVDSALFNYATLTHCLTGTDPLAIMGGNSTGGGVFTITAPGVINAGDGTIDLALSGLGTYTVYYNTTAVGNPCPSMDSVIINIVNAPGANFTYSAPFCEGDTITVLPTFGANGFAGVFSSNPGGITFVSTVTGEINLLTSSAGTFTIYNNLAASGGCAAVVDSFQIVVNPIFTTAANTSICTGDSILLGGIFQNSAGTYNDTLATTFGCDSIIQTTLAVNPIVTNPQSAAICIGDSILLGGVFQTTGGVYNDTLFTNLGCDSIVQTTLTVNTVILTALNDSICQGDSVLLGGNFQTTAGVYNDTLAAVAGCDSVLVTTLIINLIDSVVINTIDTICLSDPLILVGTGNGSGTITWYSDAAGTTVVGTGSPLVLSNPGVGIHTYYVNSVGICSSNIGSVTIVVGGVNAVINATPVTGAIPLNVFFGNGSTTGPGITYVWDFGDGSTSNIFEPSNTYNAIGNYTVMLIVSDGICSDTTIITIDAYGESVILIPNIFTPNEDGSNDLFTVDGVNLESVEGEIYNRWGQKMFSWDNVKGSWDGRTLAGSEAPDGTYFYIITAKGFDGTEYSEKGGFSLIR
jgi:gliding motility-associated-like protein